MAPATLLHSFKRRGCLNSFRPVGAGFYRPSPGFTIGFAVHTSSMLIRSRAPFGLDWQEAAPMSLPTAMNSAAPSSTPPSITTLTQRSSLWKPNTVEFVSADLA